MILRALSSVALMAGLLSVALPAPGLMAQIIRLDPPTSSPHTPDQMPQAPAQTVPPEPATERGRTDHALRHADQTLGTRTELVPLRLERLRSNDRPAARLAGESASERFILFLPQDPGATELQLAHHTGIDALPARSSLSVSVNGTYLGQIVPSSFSGFSTDTLAVPTGLLVPGRNLVEISAQHTHRVACGPDASFALWTDIDAQNSGVQMTADAFGDGPVGFMAAVAAQTARGAPITFRRPEHDAPMLGAAPFIAQAAIALGGTPPEIVSAPYWTMEDDIPQMARITAFPTGEGPAQPQFVRGGDGAQVLFLDLAQDYSPVIAELMSQDELTRQHGPAVLTPGVTQPFSALGVNRLEGQGRYIMLAVEFALPWDWVLLASQKAQLDLDYRFAAGLPEGALLLVKVNGTTIRLLPLDRDGGQALPTLPVSFGARLLQPGVNRLEFEALIPGDPPDAACPPMDGPMLQISEQSRLFVPPSPSMSLPSVDMSLSMVSAQDIVLTATAEAQLSPGLVPQIAAALLADGPPNRSRTGSAAPHLNIGTLSDIVQLQTPMLRDAIPALYDTLRPIAAQADPARVAVTPWETVGGPRGVFGWLRPGEIAGVPRRLVNALAGLAYGTTPPLHNWLDGKRAQAAVLQPDLDRPGEIWLIFAPDADPLTVVRALAASRTGRDRPLGQLALYQEGRGWENWTAPDRPLTLHEGLGPGNLRAVMGNYATLRPVPFIAIVLGLTLFSAAVALAILILTRRRGR
ncbi:cellulose biosynthesis cyclic di-GMP-binding regulatory protein BcsB [Roseinatronobacter alkalisoli]|uniref:Cyclic di-GMP-binding protein n=1 Tax=Roseinatronobacter alkalisoli TaxID=3028235 RepID=A0ABT5TE12_9RHOB|nr:cellulose biosynthesis cyclic di-GMP-binding regulatory protein BcsB [Roseinatronobacter sp. HJB301]MDD7973364.1 cellulose biosynthesis cyclic di-GMP-binding regulatory protein BcsB [Roseinatronobacter sp. HJB301]